MEAVLRHVGDVHHRLCREQLQLAQIAAFLLGERQRARRLHRIQLRLGAFEQRAPADRVLIAALGRPRGAIQPLLQSREIRERQLRVDDLHVR